MSRLRLIHERNEMNTCKNCKFFIPNVVNIEDHGFCGSGKLLDGPEDNMPPNTACGGGYDGYGDYIKVGKDFGCIHFEQKMKGHK